MAGSFRSASNPGSPSDDDRWREELQRLVSSVRIDTGSIIVSIHEGFVTKIVIKPKHTVIFNRDKMCQPDTDRLLISVHELDRFVAALGPRLRARVGPFGALRVDAKRGTLSGWRWTRKQK